jgi:hypothetical protein
LTAVVAVLLSYLQVCSALGQIAKHSVDLAEVVVEAEVFPKCLTCLKYPDEFVRKHAATLVREVVKHTPELAQLVVANGGVGALVEYCNESSGNNRCVRKGQAPQYISLCHIMTVVAVTAG